MDIKQRLQEVLESKGPFLFDSAFLVMLCRDALAEIERLEKLPANRKRIVLNGHGWFVWDDGCRWYVQPVPGNPNINMRDPTCVFEHKHNDQPAGFMKLLFDSLKGEDS